MWNMKILTVIIEDSKVTRKYLQERERNGFKNCWET